MSVFIQQTASLQRQSADMFIAGAYFLVYAAQFLSRSL